MGGYCCPLDVDLASSDNRIPIGCSLDTSLYLVRCCDFAARLCRDVSVDMSYCAIRSR